MKKQPTIAKPSKDEITVLSLSPLNEDHASLEAIIARSMWSLLKAPDLASAAIQLRQHEIPVVLCEATLQPGTWGDVLEHIKTLPHLPSVIVASRLADDRLWAEALNLGAWDVLAKPFDPTEVVRSVTSGWRRWHDQVQSSPTTLNMVAAG